MSKNRQPVERPASLLPLAHRERVGWHDHRHHQLVYPSHGVLQVSTDAGMWVVPPHRAVWLPAGVRHSHQAHGPTQLRTVNFTRDEPAFGGPTVLAVSPLLREVIIALTTDDAAAAEEGPAGDDGLTVRSRRNLERVALDQLRKVEELPLHLPVPADDRLRAIAAALADDPADRRTLAEFGRAAGASERTLSRLFRLQTSMTFPQWRAQVRLHHALILLASGSSVTSVAAACGYAGPSAFIEAFRQAFGTTPGRVAARPADASGHRP
ncbi:AraC family transcriptional regulator [Actinomadura sp. KC06]|uniref:AraC family transcriptional regulator n=1 Tax=Actinomadura sp. KC06 TaxID=2530369 RepID=UPI001049669E|nr:helix-turn-helix transcriptional regulator [Actinomadura sp. KC06]TDD32787.1 AraC family transcriptional regulator [Actinomadura sp. KC06]